MGMMIRRHQRSLRIEYMCRRVTGRKYENNTEREGHEGTGVCGLLGTSHDEASIFMIFSRRQRSGNT